MLRLLVLVLTIAEHDVLSTTVGRAVLAAGQTICALTRHTSIDQTRHHCLKPLRSFRSRGKQAVVRQHAFIKRLQGGVQRAQQTRCSSSANAQGRACAQFGPAGAPQLQSRCCGITACTESCVSGSWRWSAATRPQKT